MPTPPPLTPARDDSGDYLDVDAYAGHAFGGAPAPAPAPARDPHPVLTGGADPFAMIAGVSRLGPAPLILDVPTGAGLGGGAK